MISKNINRKYGFDNWLIIFCGLAAAISFFIVCSAIAISILQALLLIVLLLGFSLWGHILLYPVTYKKGDAISGFIWGSISGIALGGLLTSVIVYLWGWNLWLIGPLVFILPCLCISGLAFTQFGEISAKINREIDPEILLGSIFVVILFFYFPLKNAGVLKESLVVYPWLFGHDFLGRIVHVVSLSLGIPLENFHFSGTTSSYYWLAYVYPALVKNLDWFIIDTQNLLKITSLFYALLTTSAFVLFLSQEVSTKRQRVFLAILIFCCYSYSDIYFILSKLYQVLTGENEVRLLGFNLMGFSGFSHTLYRFFLVQLQATLAVGMVLLILVLHKVNQSPYSFFFIGIVAGLLFGVDATNGIMVAMYFIAISLFHLWYFKDSAFPIFKRYLITAVSMLFVYIVLFSIDMYSFQTGKGVLQISLNTLALSTLPVYLLLEYGPMFIFGIGGFILFWKNKENPDHWCTKYLFLFGVGLFFLLFIKNPVESQFGLLKATRIIPICFLSFTAYYVQKKNKVFKFSWVVISLLIVAFPSFLADNYLASNTNNPSTFIQMADLNAAKWMKKNLPKDAIIQAHTNYPEGFDSLIKPQYYYSFIPTFAERRTACGEWKLSSKEHPKVDEVRERFHSIGELFSTTDIEAAMAIIRRHNIGYIYLGNVEKNLYGKGIAKFLESMYFETVYSYKDVYILRVKETFQHHEPSGQIV
ncbi:MAG: hypothetical protein JXI43_00775 [Tissierellales bacterium]|nr:hypothetical protein [Tissierellales bacterium]